MRGVTFGHRDRSVWAWQEWGSALAVIGNANAFWGANVSWQGVGAASREAALRGALTGGAARASATT